MRDAGAERGGGREHGVGVQRVEVARQPGEARHVGLGDGAARGDKELADLQVVEVLSARLGLHRPALLSPGRIVRRLPHVRWVEYTIERSIEQEGLNRGQTMAV